MLNINLLKILYFLGKVEMQDNPKIFTIKSPGHDSMLTVGE